MRKEINFRTHEGVAVKITVNPSGFIRIEKEGAPPKSLALLSFAKAALTNPVVVEPTEGGAVLYVSDQMWVFDASSLTLTKSEAEQAQQPSTQETSQVQQPPAPTPTADAMAAVASPTSERKEVKPMATNGYRPRWMVALEGILRAQGFSDEQIQHIIASVTSDSRRRVAETFDTSTPEGKVLAMLAGLVKQCRKHNINKLTHTIRIGDDEFKVVYLDGTASLFRNSERIASYPN